MLKNIILILILALLLLSSAALAADAKEADLAGSWYPQSKAELSALLNGYLKDATTEKIEGKIFAIISPHAGYQFSGPVAAYGFKAAQAQSIKTVIIIGFAHRKSFSGIAIYDIGVFHTPLGDVAVDAEFAKEIESRDSRIRFYPDAFTDENSVEMQIPFIQFALKNAKIVPLAFGTQSYDDAAALALALANVLRNKNDYLVVASTDLSHYHPYEEANAIDRHLIDTLGRMKAKELYDEAMLGACKLCGVMPVTATLLAAEKLGFDKIKVLKYANSGDTAGDKSRVVGYLSAVLYKDGSNKKEGLPMLNEKQKNRLLQIARESITSYVRDGKRKRFAEDDPVLNRDMGAFVTLHENGELRGCIGNMAASGPLYQTVANMAVEAATGDPRFHTLSPQEIDKVELEISVLSPLKKVSSYEDVRIPGDGVIIKSGFRSGVYLPQVAVETGWTKDEFLTSLCSQKAGIEPDAWKDPATEIYVFSAEVFEEKKEGK